MKKEKTDFSILLKELEDILREETKHEETSEWNFNYFNHSKKRYLNDLTKISRYCEGGNVVEIGSAPFHLTYCLHNLGLEVIACDVAPDRFENFIKNQNLNVIQCDIESSMIPFEDNSVDFIIFNEVFEHLRINPIKTLVELKRILKPQGLLLLSTPNLYSIENVIKFLLGRGFDDPYEEFNKLEKLGHMGHVREYSKDQMKKFLEKTGFQIVEHNYCSFSKKHGIKKFMSLIRMIFPFFNSHQLFICKKYKH